MPPEDLNEVLEKLANASEKQEEYLRDMSQDSTHQTAALRGISGAFSGFKVLSAIIQKLVAVTVGNALKFDKMAVANSDININLKHTTRSMDLANVKFGTAVEHLNTTIQLHRIGYKKIDAGLRDSLVLLDKQGGQGAEVVAFMGQLLQIGASQKTQVEIAKEIAKVAQNTTTTARATMGALEQTADLVPIFKALGLEGDMLKNLTQLTADMPKDAAIALGKHFKELIHPSDMKKSMLIGGIEFGNALLNNRGFKDFEKIMRTSAPHMAQSISEFMPLFGDNVITLGKAMDIGFGDAAKFAQAAEEAFDVADSASKHQIENTDMYQTGNKTYSESMMAIADKFDRIFDVAMIEALDGFKPILQKLNAAFEQWLGEGDIFGKMESYGDKLHVWGTAVGKWIGEFTKSDLGAYTAGRISGTELMANIAADSSVGDAARKQEKQGLGAGDMTIFADKWLQEYNSWANSKMPFDWLKDDLTGGGTHAAPRTTRSGKLPYGMERQAVMDEDTKLTGSHRVGVENLNSKLNEMGDIFNVLQGEGFQKVQGMTNEGRKAQFGKNAKGFFRFPETINNTLAEVQEFMNANPFFDRWASEYSLKRVEKANKDIDYELHPTTGGADVEIWTRIEELLGIIAGYEEEGVTRLGEISILPWKGGNGGAGKSSGRKN